MSCHQSRAELEWEYRAAEHEPSAHLEPRDYWPAPKALLETRQSGLFHPRASYPYSPFRQAARSMEVRSRCKCCSDACTLTGLPFLGYFVQRQSSPDAVSERLGGKDNKREPQMRGLGRSLSLHQVDGEGISGGSSEERIRGAGQ